MVDTSAYKKRFGVDLTTASNIDNLSVIPTGIDVIDNYVVPIGGIPRGMISEFSGQPSTWKSGLAYHLIAQAQKLGLGMPVLFDGEEAFSVWAEKAGVDPEHLIYPIKGDSWTTAEDVFSQIQFFVSQRVPLIVVDSLRSLPPKEVLEAVTENREARLGALARVSNNWLTAINAGTKTTPSLRKSETAIVLINHVYEKFGVSDKLPEHMKLTTPGGAGIKFYCHLRLFFHTIGFSKEKDKLNAPVKQRIRITAIKTRFSGPLRHADIEVDWDNRIYDDADTIVTLGVDKGIIKASGSWYSINGQKFQGKAAVVEFINNDPELKNNIFFGEAVEEEESENPFEE